jgi:hypothetical protein
MAKERHRLVIKILREDYTGLTLNMTDQQILNDIVTILLAKKICPKAYKKLYKRLDNI